MEQSQGSFLPLSTPIGESTVFDEHIKKHPDPSPITPRGLVASSATSFQSCYPTYYFDCLDGDLFVTLLSRLRDLQGLWVWMPWTGGTCVLHFELPLLLFGLSC